MDNVSMDANPLETSDLGINSEEASKLGRPLSSYLVHIDGSICCEAT